MHQPVHLRFAEALRHVRGEAVNLALVRHVADEHGGVAGQLTDGFAAGVGVDGVEDRGAGVGQQLGSVPSDGFFVGDAGDEDGFAGELEEVHAGQDRRRPRNRKRAAGRAERMPL